MACPALEPAIPLPFTTRSPSPALVPLLIKQRCWAVITRRIAGAVAGLVHPALPAGRGSLAVPWDGGPPAEGTATRKGMWGGTSPSVLVGDLG